MPYAGGKQRIADRIVALFPTHTHYVEPYFGAGSVLLAKPPSDLETINDLNNDLMIFWRVLREQPAELHRVCALTPHSRTELKIADDRVGLPDLEIARRVWVKLTQGRAARMDADGWRYVRRQATSIPTYLAGYVGRFSAVAERLARVSLECRPAIDVISNYGRDDTSLLYLDPPYLGDRYRAYEHEMMDIASHEELLAAIAECSAMVAISGYRTAIYDQALREWYRVDIPASNLNRDLRIESVWLNYTPPADTLPLEASA